MSHTTQNPILEAIFSDIHVAEGVLLQAGVNLAERREENRVFIAKIKALVELGFFDD